MLIESHSYLYTLELCLRILYLHLHKQKKPDVKRRKELKVLQQRPVPSHEARTTTMQFMWYT